MPDEFERFVRALGRPYGGTFLLDRQEVKQTGRVRALSLESPFHSALNGLVIRSDVQEGSAQVVVGKGRIEMQTLRDGHWRDPGQGGSEG